MTHTEVESMHKASSLENESKKIPKEASVPRGFAPIFTLQQFGIVVAVLLVAVAGMSAYTSMKNKKAAASRDALYAAQQLFEEEEKALLPPTPKPEPVASGSKAKAPAPAAAPPSVAFKTLDVDASYPKTVSALKKVIQEYPKTLSSFQAQLLLANLYADHGASGKALPYYSAASEQAQQPMDKAGALGSLAQAQESAGQCGEAIKTAERALNQGVAAVKGDLLVLQARCYETTQSPTQAKAVYDKIIKDLPGTPFSRLAEIYSARLGVK